MTLRHTFLGRLQMRWGWITSVRRVPLFEVHAVGKSYFTYTLAHFLAKQGLGHVDGDGVRALNLISSRSQTWLAAWMIIFH